MAAAMLIEACSEAQARQLAAGWTRKITARSAQVVNARNASAAWSPTALYRSHKMFRPARQPLAQPEPPARSRGVLSAGIEFCSLRLNPPYRVVRTCPQLIQSRRALAVVIELRDENFRLFRYGSPGFGCAHGFPLGLWAADRRPRLASVDGGLVL